MDIRFFLRNIRDIILNPARGWERVQTENRPVVFVKNNFLLPLVILTAISAFLGSWIFTHTTLNIAYSILVGIKYFLLFIILTWFTAYILSETTRALDLGRNFMISFDLIAFSLTPLFLCQIISRLFESMIFVNILAFYGLYIFWSGAEKLLNPPEHKKVPMLVVMTAVVIFTFIIVNKILTVLIERLYFTVFA